MPGIVRFSVVVGAFLLLVAGPAHGEGKLSIRLNGAAAQTIDVAGLAASDLATLGKLASPEEWQVLLAVYVAPAPGKERGPALLGSYRVEDGVVRFEPRFPLVPRSPLSSGF